MADSLQTLLESIRRLADEAELQQGFTLRLRQYFNAKRCAIFFHKDMNPTLMAAMAMNPVVRYLLERHAPVHEGVVLEAGQWEAICHRSDHGHVMAGPLVRDGELVGVVAMTRDSEANAFDAENLADLTALCLHLSAWLAAQANTTSTEVVNSLTARERQIANLVARGLTNAQISAELYISESTVKAALKRMFQKLGVVSRAELVAHLRT